MPGPLIDQNYVDESQSLTYCPTCSLPYRPDARIYPNADTHCPKGGHPLISRLDIMRGRQVEDQSLYADEDGINYIW